MVLLLACGVLNLILTLIILFEISNQLFRKIIFEEILISLEFNIILIFLILLNIYISIKR